MPTRVQEVGAAGLLRAHVYEAGLAEALRRENDGLMRQAEIRVVVADREPAFRAGLKAALASARYDVVGEASTVAALVARSATHPADVLLIDEALLSYDEPLALPFAYVGVLVRDVTVARLLELFAVGARGCISRSVQGARVPLAVEDLAAGHLVVPPELVTAIVEYGGAGREPSGDGSRLTRRQSQILTLIEEGLGDTQIARLLGVSPITVRRHLSDVAARTGSSARGQRRPVVAA
jgi:DNA-binding NarL/FixJ family response regulator